jgi:hypothetical protein
MAFYVDMRADLLRSLSYTGIGTNYFPIPVPGSSPLITTFTHPMRIMIVQNLTNATLTFSFDGINDHFVLPSIGQLIMDVSSDEFQQNGFIISVNTTMSVKGTATSGAVYVSAFYARGS